MSGRKERVEHALRDVLTSAIRDDIKDPRVRAATLITVAKVELNVDKSVARIYVSIIGKDHVVDAAMIGLQKAASFLRGPIARELNLQHAPELRFIHDVSIDVSEKLGRILRDDEEKARAVGREPGQGYPSPPPSAEPEPDAEPAGEGESAADEGAKDAPA